MWHKNNRVFRFLRIMWVFLTHLVLYPVNSHRNEIFGERLRKALEALGVVFEKIGQILSGRYDFFKEADLAELRILLDRAPPLPDELMFSVIAQELGTKAKRLQNLAFMKSAQIGQVYIGMIDGKKQVCVKVLKPGTKEQAELDFSILYTLARIAELFFPTLRTLRVLQIVKDMGSWILDETDFSHELRNIESFRTQLTNYFQQGRVIGLGRVIIPKIYPKFSTNRVLTMEYLRGITANEWIDGKRPDPGQVYDPGTSVLTLLVSSFRPLFAGRPCLFHGDPHPGNIILMEGGNVGLVDFGLVGHYSEELMPGFKDMFFACYLRSASMFTSSLIRFVKVSDERYDELFPDVQEFVKNAVDRRFKDMLMGLLEIIRKHRLAGPMLLSILAKFNLLVDSLSERFCPDRSVEDILRKEFMLALLFMSDKET